MLRTRLSVDKDKGMPFRTSCAGRSSLFLVLFLTGLLAGCIATMSDATRADLRNSDSGELAMVIRDHAAVGTGAAVEALSPIAQARAAEDRLAQTRQAQESNARVAELSKNINDLNKLQSAGATASAPAGATPADGGGSGGGEGDVRFIGNLLPRACLTCVTGGSITSQANQVAGAARNNEFSALANVTAPGVGASLDVGKYFRNPSDLLPKQNSDKASDTVRLLFGTNRQPSSDTKGSMRNTFTSTRGDVAFGYVDVSVPPTHVVGAIERPSIWKLQISDDPTLHMVIRGISLVQSNQFANLINQYRGPKSGKPTILFVHGYNVSFDDAALRTAQIAYDLRMDSVPAFFSWASRAGVADYTVDENTALQSIPDFKKFLRAFATNSTDRIFLIAHSMGSRIVSQALTEMISTESQVVSKVTQLVLAAPDLDAVVFKEQIVPAFRKQNIPVTLYASSKDKTLQASSKIHGCCRAGLGGSNIVISEGLESVDATAIDTGFLSHSYFAETRPLLTDLNLLLAQGMRAASRPLLGGKPVGNPTYYYFRQ